MAGEKPSNSRSLMSTSVPPAMGNAVGYSAFAARASSQVAGRRNSMRVSPLVFADRVSGGVSPSEPL